MKIKVIVLATLMVIFSVFGQFSSNTLASTAVSAQAPCSDIAFEARLIGGAAERGCKLAGGSEAFCMIIGAYEFCRYATNFAYCESTFPLCNFSELLSKDKQLRIKQILAKGNTASQSEVLELVDIAKENLELAKAKGISLPTVGGYVSRR
jgi:hypothetical protein